jgi:hypothetical protein
VYAVCLDFFNGTVNIEAINNSFITLIPKVNNPACVNDFRPIPLINCVVKIITKLLGDRLQFVIIPLVHKTSIDSLRVGQFKIALHGLLSTYTNASTLRGKLL